MSRKIKRVPAGYVHDGQEHELPPGDAYQVWEDISDEGSPLSPVLIDRADVVVWLVEHERCCPAAAEEFIESGWAPTHITNDFGTFTGIQMFAGVAAHIEWLHRQAGDDTTIAPDTPVRHKESGIEGTIVSRVPPPNGDLYLIAWDRGIPEFVAKNELDPDEPMDAANLRSEFDVLEAAAT